MSQTMAILFLVAILLGIGVAALLLWMSAKAHLHVSQTALEQMEKRLVVTEKALFETRGQADGLSKECAKLSERAGRLEKVDKELVDLRSELDRERLAHSKTLQQVTALTTSNEAQRCASEKELALLTDAEARLTASFEILSLKVLDEKTKRFDEESKALLNPLKTQLESFQTTIAKTWANDQRERGGLSQEIQTLKGLNQRISDDATNLTRALKGDSRAQGAWGEMVLERVLEASGLQVGREYELQPSYQDEDGSRARPDVVVHLPGEKDVVIDAKVSLVAYERLGIAVDEDSRATALRDHLASIKRHIDGLSGRGYQDWPGIRTLDFVLMFVPVEPAFIEAVRADGNLYTYALSKNISLVSPSTLLATLRTIEYLWKIERRNINALDFAKVAGELHDNFALLIKGIQDVGKNLGDAQTSHNVLLRRLTEGGKGSVLLKAQKLMEMGATAKKNLPRALLDRAGGGDESIESDSSGAENDDGAE